MKQFNKYLQLPKDEKLLLFEAVFLLFCSKGLLLLFPFRYCLKRLKTKENATEGNPVILQKIRDAVYRANKLAIWTNICLVKSYAARLMLQRRNIGSVMYLGLQLKNGKELVAHAWLVSAEIYITPKGRTNYKVIYDI